MSRAALAVATLLMIAVLPGTAGGRGETSTKPLVVATIFPNFDFSRIVAGDRLEVRLLLPPGVEAHTYEPTPSDLTAVARAAAFVYTGDAMEPWVPGFLDGVGNRKLVVVDSSSEIELVEENGEDRARQDEHDRELDPHVWLDPTLAVSMVRTIAEAFSRLDPQGAATYRTNAQSYAEKLLELDRRISDTLAPAKGKTIVYGGHFAFGYFARRYGLEYVSPYRGFAPDAEPTPQSVAELVDVLRNTGTRVVFYEELLEPRVAQAIADATRARLELLHGAHNVTRAELDAGIGYLSIMEDNLRKLKEALVSP